MSPNTTLPLAFSSPQPNSTGTDVIVNIVFGTAGVAVSAFTIYHGHQMWKLWRLDGNRSHDEEHELESVPDTASGGYNNAPPTRGSLALSESSAADTTGVNDVDGALEEHELGSVPDTASGGYNNTPPTRGSLAPSEPSTADNTPPTRGSLALSEPSATGTTGVIINDLEHAVGENKDVQL